MKKLILFLLLPLWAIAQTTTGQEQEFDYGIKNNSTQTITTPPYLTTTGMDGTQGKIPSALIEKTDNKQNSLAVDGTGTKYPTVDAVNTGLALKALDSNVVHKTGNETVAGVKTFSSNIKLQTGILELNNSDGNGYGSILLNYNRFLFKDKTDKIQFLIEEGNFSTYKTSSILGRFVNSDLTATRNYGLPDASGTIALISQTVTNGVTTSSPSQDAVYDFVTANAVTLGTTNGLSLSGQQISLGLSSTSTIGALSSTDWNVFNNKQNNLVSGTNIKTIEGQSLLGSGNIDLAKSDVGLSNVDNTSDANKPVSTAQQTALNLKENSFAKNTAFNKNFGTTAGTVAEGNDSRILNGQTSFGWGNHAGKYPLYNGTGATGTWGINISGNAASATSWGSREADLNDINNSVSFVTVLNPDGIIRVADPSGIKSFLGLGSNAYTSTAFLPLSGGTLSGIVTAPTAAPGTTGNQIATLDYVLANSGSTSGNYTPTLYDFANTSARKLVKATYSKIGDIVTVFIHLTVDVITANTDTVVTVSLPINKVNTSLYELGAGVGRLSSVNTNEFTVRTSNVTNTNDIIRLVFKPVSSGTNIVSASFSYAIN